MNVLTKTLTALSSNDLISTLDECFCAMRRSPSLEVVDDCVRRLADLYDEAAAHMNLESFRSACQSHPLHRLILEDPFSRRAFEKPRGYAGDAVMLDYIYRAVSLNLSDAGHATHAATTSLSTAESIIWRQNHLAFEIAKTLERDVPRKILAVACGHLRELDLVEKLTANKNMEIVALDHDQASLDVAIRSYPRFKIHPVNRSISYLFKQAPSDFRFDLIYSAGLFDYLPDKTAAALVRKLTELLHPGGRLIVGNYAPENYGRGFMEGLMGWSLIYRDEGDLIKLIDSGMISDIEYRVYRDDPGNVAYLEVSRSGVNFSRPQA